MSIKVNDVANTMVEAVRGPLARIVGKRWPAVRKLVTEEMQTLASALLKIKRQYDTGKIDAARARELLVMHARIVDDVLRHIKGIGIYTARQTIDAAVRAALSLIGLKDPRSHSSASSGKSTAATTRAAGAELTATAASIEPTQEVAPSFKAGKDL